MFHHRRPNYSFIKTLQAMSLSKRGSVNETLYSFMQGGPSITVNVNSTSYYQHFGYTILSVTLRCGQQLDYTASKWQWSDPGTIPTFAGEAQENHEHLQPGEPVFCYRFEPNPLEYGSTVSPLPKFPSAFRKQSGQSPS